jgi:hypothetical protein
MFAHQLREVRIHLGRVAEVFVDLRESARRRDVLRRRAQDRLELFARGLQIAGFDQRASERDARGQIRGMPLEACETGCHRFLVASEAPVFLRERRKRNRRRVGFDPASQFLYPRILRDNSFSNAESYEIVTVAVAIPEFP